MMMNATIQVTVANPQVYFSNASVGRRLPLTPGALQMSWDPLSMGTSLCPLVKPLSNMRCAPILKSRKPLHVCLAGGQGMMENNQDGSWTSFDKTMEQFKGQSLEDLFRQEIQKGGGGAKPPHGGGGGGGGSSGGSDDGRFGLSDETLQVVLATIGFLFVYICVIDGMELAKLARDGINYMITGKQSIRLKRAAYKWTRLYRMLTEKKEADKRQSENASTSSNTSYYRNAIRNYMEPNSDE
ncbi:hypothetical protein HN51_060069 [Arachis hypogaea]|uniref:Uncharacterized protein n=1 Tax=Arachis hypogaea TaxID=3818 RepID=A0A444X8D4_ARAHY|nr:uncharacterized protein LOC107623817 [Arachis ipaensis]XP_020968701.1 uncharacterized protein LOC107623817 [Arachis ipaensis]XP_025682000.1 uncharacterized protein LOC112783313 [Arachis hypogaea]RYQ85956.1 hypothetical protein Ahy_B10g105602 [Arachis hypogaea]